jgi:hypothetical protein
LCFYGIVLMDMVMYQKFHHMFLTMKLMEIARGVFYAMVRFTRGVLFFALHLVSFRIYKKSYRTDIVIIPLFTLSLSLSLSIYMMLFVNHERNGLGENLHDYCDDFSASSTKKR